MSADRYNSDLEREDEEAEAEEEAEAAAREAELQQFPERRLQQTEEQVRGVRSRVAVVDRCAIDTSRPLIICRGGGRWRSCGRSGCSRTTGWTTTARYHSQCCQRCKLRHPPILVSFITCY